MTLGNNLNRMQEGYLKQHDALTKAMTEANIHGMRGSSKNSFRLDSVKQTNAMIKAQRIYAGLSNESTGMKQMSMPTRELAMQMSEQNEAKQRQAEQAENTKPEGDEEKEEDDKDKVSETTINQFLSKGEDRNQNGIPDKEEDLSVSKILEMYGVGQLVNS